MTFTQGIKKWKLPGDKKSAAIILLLLWVSFAVFASFSDCNAGGGDNYAHYNIARWAFRYPHLFFDMWGKPVFTLLTSPFALLGFYWVRIFNITCGVLTAWLGFLTVRRWNQDYAFLAPVFILFAPLYFVMLFTGMTEILFSLLLMLAVYLFFRDSHIPAAIVLSFLYFVRAEGILMIPLFLLAFLLKRRYKAIPFLLTGVLFYSLAGLLYYYHDFFWLFNNVPYTGGEGGGYGRGTWYHFFQTMPEYLGYAGIVVLVSGTLSLLIEFIRSGWRLKSESFFIILTVCAPFYGYLFAHVVLWMIGEVSLGLTRVMAGVLPLAGVLGVRGFRFFAGILPREKWKLSLALLTIFVTVVPGLTRYRSEFRGHPENEVFKKVAAWMRESGNDRVKIVTQNGYLPFILGMDPWDTQKIQYNFTDPVISGKELPDSSLVVWDAHFSPNEGQLPLELLMKNPDFELVRIFKPEVPFKVLGNNDFKIYVFRKIKNIASQNYLLEKKLELSEGMQFNLNERGLLTLYQPPPANGNKTSGIDSLVMVSPETEHAPGIVLTGDDLDFSSVKSCKLQFIFVPMENLSSGEVFAVFSFEENGKPFHYYAEDISEKLAGTGDSCRISYDFSPPGEIKKGTYLKSYIWNAGGRKFGFTGFTVAIIKKENK